MAVSRQARAATVFEVTRGECRLPIRLSARSYHGYGKRTLVMTFSKFGRRVAENASQGTDHGAAAPMFLAGTRVRAGLVGEHPNLDELEDGDVKFHTDFRQVYATLLERWLGWSSKPVLGGAFKPIDALRV